MIQTQLIEYNDETTLLEGFYARPENNSSRLPAILVVHDWSGRNQFADNKAKQLADLGYVGFALDIYGKGKLGQTKEEKMALMSPFMEDRLRLQKRLLAAFNQLKQLPGVDPDRIGIIGFCFGGLCALDLARSGADLKATVSFHGLLNAPETLPKHAIKSKILALHGYDDPMVTPDQVMQFANEMTEAKVNWQIDMYGNTMHAFTNPEANDPSFGTVYNACVVTRAWNAMQDFFNEVFGK